MDEEVPYKVYWRKEDWDRQARYFLLVGFVLGLIVASLLAGELWFLFSF